MDQSVIYAFILTLIAGLSTGIGSLIALLAKRTNTKFLSASLGFSAGVMIYVSFVDILPHSIDIISTLYEGKIGDWLAIAAFFAGILLIALIDKMVPQVENPHEMRSVENMQSVPSRRDTGSRRKLMRMGMMTALIIAIHNFPEGIATFMSALDNPTVGIAIALAIAIHNIPEGIAVSVPIYYATGSKRKAFKYSLLSGLSEPIGAIVGYLILAPFLTPLVFGIIFAMVAGIMIYIALDELLPAAREYGEHHIAIWGLIAGMAVMAVGVLVLG